MVYRVDSGKKIIIKAWTQTNISKKLYLLFLGAKVVRGLRLKEG